ncbi:MAG: DUF2339 domain-containing protein [bacterium]
MPHDDHPRDSGSASGAEDASDAGSARLAALERDVAALRMEIAALRGALTRAGTPGTAVPPPAGAAPAFVSPAVASALRQPPAPPLSSIPAAHASPSLSDRLHAAAPISGVELESLVGRYGTLALAALVILMAVGAIIKMAVQRGLLTPDVRVAAGLLVATALAGAGLFFRRRGEVRYGGVLLALSLAVVDLVAWAAGPRFHLVPTVAALAAVDVVSLLLVTLALKDRSEFLFVVAIGGALSAPFVTSDGGGTAIGLLSYCAVVLMGALSAARDPAWWRAFALMVLGALVYSLAAAALPAPSASYGAYVGVGFGGLCAAMALLAGADAWRSELPRAFLAVTVVGVLAGWDAVATHALAPTVAVGVLLAAVTYAALLTRRPAARLWTVSAVALPFVSLGAAYPGAASGTAQGWILALWSVFAFVAWQVERRRGEPVRSGAHLLAAVLLGCLAVTAWLWHNPLLFVSGLAGWAVVAAALARHEESALPLAGVGVALGGAMLSAFDQLASRGAYSYAPFATRSSVSALMAAVGIAAAGELIGRGDGSADEVAPRAVRLGVLIGFVIVWGRMEVAHAFNPDLASFLLTSYYAACGVASIVAGRRLVIGRLRVAGLCLALYAAFKAVAEVTDIGSVPLRVGAYAAVGVFLLGAGYLYRDARTPSLAEAR